jgi:uncharacterized membrane protein
MVCKVVRTLLHFRPLRPRLFALAIGLSAAAPCPALAADGGEPYSVWTYSLYKTITYELLARTADVPVFYLVAGGAGASGLAFTLANLATGAATYYFFEVAWNSYGPTIEGQPTGKAIEIESEKTALFRVVATARKLSLGYAFTGSPVASIGFALISNAVSGAIYAANEYGWYVYGPSGAPSRINPTGDVPAPDMETRALVAVESSAAYLGGLATTAEGALVGRLASALADLRQRL